MPGDLSANCNFTNGFHSFKQYEAQLKVYNPIECGQERTTSVQYEDDLGFPQYQKIGGALSCLFEEKVCFQR